MVGRGREPATFQKGAAALVAMIGTALAIGVFHSGVQPSAIGIGAALLASFGYSFYNIAGQGLVTRNHPFTVMFYLLLSSAAPVAGGESALASDGAAFQPRAMGFPVYLCLHLHGSAVYVLSHRIEIP